ncbi:uncharacterized protein LOC104918098 [Larimichthys crocea]|uniref:uncharacterized protein LOC104918098 n=1 Tax=Larimichthys crocea TaxID=215358 RepID=UPI000F5E8544|nr:uncharacterized protein LOC104918098 [Larimichthys crocea]
MAIGKNSRKSSVRSSVRAPKFLDKSNGFYGRLDEPEVTGDVEEVMGKEVEDSNREEGVVSNLSLSVVHVSAADEKEEAEVFGFNEGMMEDDVETLLQRKPSRRSSRWRRSSRRKQKEGRAEGDAARDERPSVGTETPVEPDVLEGTKVMIEVEMEKMKKLEEEKKVIHFAAREDADDQVLIRDKKRGRDEEGEEESRMKKEQEEGMKMVKRKNYRKALDRALRRGWEAFITNLYSVTLTPVTSSSPSLQKKQQHSSVLAELR